MWTIKYTTTADKQLSKLDKHIAKKIILYIEDRIALLEDPHHMGSPLVENFKNLWRFDVVIIELFAKYKMRFCVYW